MNKCGQCGTINLEHSIKCDDCGNLLSSVSVPVRKTTRSAPIAQTQTDAVTVEEIEDLVNEDLVDEYLVEDRLNEDAPVVPVPSHHSMLVIQRGDSAGKAFKLVGDDITIGRWDPDAGIFPEVDLESDDVEAKVSRRHARILRQAGAFLIEDLGSTNGTFVNRGRRLTPGEKIELKEGDEIIVGKTFLKFNVIK